MAREKSKKWRVFGRIEVEMKAEEGRRDGGINREQLAYATPMPQTSEAIRTREKRTADRRELGVK